MTSTPTGLRPITLHLRNSADEVIGSASIRLVLASDTTSTSGSWAITHTLGSPAGGTHTEVAFVDGTLGRRDLDGDGTWNDPERERLADDLVRQVANLLYARTWAFHYRPEQVADSVLAHGSRLRERVEVSEVEVYEQ